MDMLVIKVDSDADIAKRIDELAAKFEPEIRKEFLKAIEGITSKIDIEEIAAALEAGDTGLAMRLVEFAVGTLTFAGVLKAIQSSFVAGGGFGAEIMRQYYPNSVNIVFDAYNQQSIDWIRNHDVRLVGDTTKSMAATVENVLRRSIQQGTNPLQTAREIRRSIGLTAKQEQAVANFKRMLEEGDSATLQRALRDKRFDSTVRRAIRGEIKLSQDKIDKMVKRYRERYLKYRSETIARTESIRAVQAGNYLAWKVMADAGIIDASKVRRKWQYTADSRVRHAHVTIPLLNPEGVGLDEPFLSELGPIMYPGDPAATAGNTINCRCTSVIRVLP